MESGKTNLHKEEEEVYDAQYHPKAELGNIFGGYRDKYNNADHLANIATPPESPGLNYMHSDDDDDGNHR